LGSVYTEFERELAALESKFSASPKRQIIKLLLLALEREAIVSQGYREEAILRRIHSLDISEEVRELVHQALLWAWKDEQMHEIYMRGALFKYGSLPLRLLAFVNQFAGTIGGWSTSVRQHVRFKDAPLSRCLANLITWMGFVTGKVPKDVRQHLRYSSFREFALFNVDAEATAWLCFKRLSELFELQPNLDANVIEDIRRTQLDEERHNRIFEILANAFDDQDRLAETESAETLAQQIREVGEAFLPRRLRKAFIAENPLGSGGKVFVKQGAGREEKIPLFQQTLDEAGLRTALEARANQTGKPLRELRIAIKVNFMMGYHRKDTSMITDQQLVEGLAEFLRSLGCTEIAVVEARNLYDNFYQNRSVEAVAEYFNFVSNRYRLADASSEQEPHQFARGMGQRTVSKTWKEADFRISFAKMCSHPVDIVYLTLNNIESLGENCQTFIFAERQAHKETAVMMLLDDFPPHFALIDAYDSAADGLLGMMSCRRPKTPRRFYAGRDALAVDMVAARHQGLQDVENAGLICTARQWFGNPAKEIEVVGTDEAIKDWRGAYHNEWSTFLSLLARPVYEFGSSRGAAFVPEMDEEAFPLNRPESFILKMRRRSLQAFLGIRHRR
jgi:uncharacterized protein (DUF362 family)